MYMCLDSNNCLNRENIILPSQKEVYQFDEHKESVVVIVYLYYEEKVDWYIKYILQIPMYVDLVIISSKEDVLKRAECALASRKASFCIKNNRGRDISALLVAAHDVIKKYDIVCFLHDKKEKVEYQKKDLMDWEDHIWSNLMCNEIYIKNVLGFLQKNMDIGLLVPPLFIPHSTILNKGIHWENGDKERTEKFLKEILKYDVSIDESKISLSVGTVFWARSEIFSKILDKEWKYSDFPCEPMPDDGTISHAIERSFPFLARDIGLRTVAIMNEKFTQIKMEKLENLVLDLVEYIGIEKDIRVINEIVKEKNRKERINNLLTNCRVFIYGAGKIARKCYDYLATKDVKPICFIVSQKDNESETFNGYRIIGIDDYEWHEGDLIVIATGTSNCREIKTILEKKKILDYLRFVQYTPGAYSDFIESGGDGFL